MMDRRLGHALMALLVVAICSAPAWSDETIVVVSDLEPEELASESFTVKTDTRVHITAIGAKREKSEGMFAYPWIIDAESRSLVWSMDEEFTKPVKNSGLLYQFDDDVRLHPGSYEIYYHAGSPFFVNFNGSWDSEDLGDLLKELGSWLDKDKDWSNDYSSGRDLARRFYVKLVGDPDVVEKGSDIRLAEPVVSLRFPDNDAYMSEGFTLKEDMDLTVYSMGEYSRSDDIMVDYGWIVNAKTRERVWQLSRSVTDWAGGAEKNRRARDVQHFPAGDYVAYYVTDDSHTYDDWNATPPFDPQGWGMQMYVTDPDDRGNVVPYVDDKEERPILRLTRIGDNELVSGAFKVTEPVSLRIYAIGEYDRFNGEMADRAWIVRPDVGKKIWVMTGEDSEPAGGAAKNRRFDGVRQFEPGEYVVYFSTDGSHSYGDGWNAAPPHDQRSYGVTIFPVEESSSTRVSVIDKRSKRPDALAEITEVGDGEERHARFTLTSPTRVRVYSIGEGTRHGMVDYGWIENETTGDILWEMTYRKTSHAGGAKKNRLADQVILLDKGEYVVYYVTDGTHATGDWNASAPDDPASWGITLTQTKRDGD